MESGGGRGGSEGVGVEVTRGNRDTVARFPIIKALHDIGLYELCNDIITAVLGNDEPFLCSNQSSVIALTHEAPGSTSDGARGGDVFRLATSQEQ